MKLRDYQINMIDQIYKGWSEGHINILPQLSTGAGKTVIMGKILSEYTGYSIAIAHRVELVSQISTTLARFGIRHNIIAQKQTIRDIISIHNMEFNQSFYDPHGICTVAAVDTLLRLNANSSQFSRIGLVIIDEAAHVLKTNKWGKAASLFPNARGLYPTATPLRADGRGLGRYADGIVDTMIIGPSMRELIKQGYLSDYRIFAPPNDLDLKPVPISASGDYNPAKLRTAVHKSHITGDVVSHYLKIAPNKLGVTFAVDIRSALEIAAEFRENGIPAEVISSKTSDILRHTIMQKFRNREILQIVNVDILGEGVDVPAIEVVSMARPTQSYALFAQQFGRGLRPLPGKSHAIIIDHVNNVLRHGLPDSPRQWSLDRRERRSRTTTEDVIPLKTCLKCLSVFDKFHKVCPFCGFYSPPAVRSSPEFVDGDLLELDADVLAKLRGEIVRIDSEARVPMHIAPYIQRAIVNKHQERQEKQYELRKHIALWAGHQKSQGYEDSIIYRKFYHLFGIDILSAQALNTKDAETLMNKIIRNIDDMVN
jgi:DNA repair protein RadD